MKYKIFVLFIGLFSLVGCAGANIVEENMGDGTFIAKYRKYGGSTEEKSHQIALDQAREKCAGDFEIVKNRTVVEPQAGLLFPVDYTFVELTFKCKK